jgi:DNA primase
MISEFRLGYAPDQWEGLTSFITRRGLDTKLAVQAGLIIPKKRGGFYDRFRGRIIFPIFNQRGQVIGFGGRVLDDSLPKYLNTPETPVFKKGAYPYGLQSSYKSIREKGRAIVVEGYMDFLALRKHGLEEVVATLGTALTPDHIRKLKGYAKETVIVFDSDDAGRKAVLRSLPLFLNEGVSARTMILPDGHDPDSFVNAEGLEKFQTCIDQSPPMFDFYLDDVLARKEAGVDGKVQVLKEIIPVLSELRNVTQQSLYVRHLSERVGIPEETARSDMKRWRKGHSEKALERNLRDRMNSSRVEKKFSRDVPLLNLLIHYPRHIDKLMNCEWQVLISDPDIEEILNAFFEKYRSEGSFQPEALFEKLENEAAQQQLREALLLPPFYTDQTVDLAVTEFEEKIDQIRISKSIHKAKEKGDLEGLNQLLKMKSRKDQMGLAGDRNVEEGQ